jgi:hypothetical protein
MESTMRKHSRHCFNQSLPEPVIKMKDSAQPSSDERGHILNPIFDERLQSEIEWCIKVLDRLLPVFDQPVDSDICYRAICETLMSVGLVAREATPEGTVMKLKPQYRRGGPMIVLFHTVLGVVLEGVRDGLGPDECVDKGLDMRNWRPIEPLPPEVRPLVRKAQRAFPVSLVRKMPLELFWFMMLPRILDHGLVERQPR